MWRFNSHVICISKVMTDSRKNTLKMATFFIIDNTATLIVIPPVAGDISKHMESDSGVITFA